MYHHAYRLGGSRRSRSAAMVGAVVAVGGENVGDVVSQSVPRACDEWIVLFQRFGEGDDSSLAEMQRGALELTRPERQRWLAALVDALQLRLARLSMQLGERLNVAIRVGDVSGTLGWLRAQVQPLYRLSAIPAFPPTVRERITRSCIRWLQRSQARSEREANCTRDRELWLLTVRRSPLRWPPLTSTCQ